MPAASLVSHASYCLEHLCLTIPSRRVGSAGNQAATDFFARQLAELGFQIERPAFACIDWHNGGGQLVVQGESFSVQVSPYSLGCRATGPLVAAANLTELESVPATGAILLLHGELSREQLFPKNFPFFQVDEHQRIIQLLETKQPAAIVAATTRNPEVAGGVYPFPLIEDGDFDIPSVYLTAEEGERLAQLLGATATLTIDAERIPATGCNVVARKLPDAPRRVVVCAHIDAKDGTPGALDNAAGVVVLLLLGELLANYQGELGVELVAINGEDYYSNPGEQRYLADNQGRFDDIVLGVNIDGVGYVEGKTAYSLYECPAAMAAFVHQAFAAPDVFVGGEPWVQGDHALFLMNRRPTVAITSEQIMDLLAEIPHTPKDRPELVDCAKLAETAEALYELLGVLGGLRQ